MPATDLARLLWPRTVAVVGASEKLGMSNNAVLPMLEAGIDVRLVNPNRDAVYERTCFPSLSAIGEPVDAVLALVSAARSVAVVEEARRLGCGGVVVAAGGFAELGDEGRNLQAQLVEAGGGELPIVGPNCSGFMNVPRQMNLFTGGRMALSPGPVAIVSQSGFLVRSSLAAGRERQLGFSLAISSGNEAVCDLADYIDVLGADAQTRVVCLVIEKIRDADRFFAAVTRARAAGTAIIALKLGRTEQSREIMRSHTGAIADESWVYDLVLRHAGVLTARDVDEMLDLAQLLAQLPSDRWRPVPAVAVVASSGGVAGVAADTASEEGIALAGLSGVESWVRATIPGNGSLNPLDMTGFVMRDRELLEELFERYGRAAGSAALVLCWWAADGDEAWSRTLLEPFAVIAARAGVPFVVTPVEATALGSWTAEFRARGVSFCRGLRSTFRALDAVHRVATAAPPDIRPRLLPATSSPPRGLVPTSGGRIVPFADAMELLAEFGIDVCPYVVLDADCDDAAAIAELGDRLVVKLADVPHRTELDGVRLDVSPEGVPRAVGELRAQARAGGERDTIVVQSMLPGRGEVFIGLQGRSDLGAVVLLGRGGVLVEIASRLDGRRLPLYPGDAEALVEAVAGGVGSPALRGEGPLPMAALVGAVEGIAELWRRHGTWLASCDVNPLIVTGDRVVAVDALLVVD